MLGGVVGIFAIECSNPAGGYLNVHIAFHQLHVMNFGLNAQPAEGFTVLIESELFQIVVIILILAVNR